MVVLIQIEGLHLLEKTVGNRSGSMGHWHMFNTSQIFEPGSDQGRNHGEQPYMPIVFRGAPESGSISNPLDSMPMLREHVPSQWATSPRSSGYASPLLNSEIPQYQPIPPLPFRDPFVRQPTTGILHMPQENYLHHPSSSSIGGQSVPGTDRGFYDQTMSSRGSYKRKSPIIPPMCGRGSTSSHYDGGSSSEVQFPAERWQEKRESHHTHWEYPPSHGVNGLSIGGDGTHRNVRSRAAVDLDTNLPRSHLPSNSLHHLLSTQSSGPSNYVDIWGESSNVPRKWSHALIPPPPHGIAISTDPGFSSHVPSSLNLLNSHPSNIAESGGFIDEIFTNRNHAPPQYVNSYMYQSIRGHRSGYGQRYAPIFRASSSNNDAGHVPASEEQHIVAENHPSRRPHTFSNLRLRNIDRNGRISVSSDRYRSFTQDASFRDRLMPESLMVLNRSAAYYGPRTLFDQHRDMRLDIDNMTYEELLALGEEIGTVSTGLQDVSISKCLAKSIYCSSDALQDEGTCVICLEEYINMDDVGTLKSCRHDFHAGCIRKWLSMKNLCPICKATAMEEK